MQQDTAGIAASMGFPMALRTNRKVVMTQSDRIWFHSAVERHRDTVFRVAFNYLKSATDADDVCQDTFLALYRSNREFENDEHLKAWLLRVTINRCKTMFRMPWTRVENIDDYADRLEMPEQQREVLRAVMGLPEKYRIPVYLFYYEGYHTDEIARLLDVPGATVRTRLARARKRLAAALGEDGFND